MDESKPVMSKDEQARHDEATAALQQLAAEEAFAKGTGVINAGNSHFSRIAPPDSSRGAWIHAGWLMCESVVGPTGYLGLAFGMSLMGWAGGITMMIVSGIVVYYTSLLCARLCAPQEGESKGIRYSRYRDLASQPKLLGPFWGPVIVFPSQWANLVGVNISTFVGAGAAAQNVWRAHNSTLNPATGVYSNDVRLQYWALMVAGAVILLAQVPTYHKLRFINLIGVILSLAVALVVIIAFIYTAQQPGFVYPSYSRLGTSTDQVFNIFTGFAIMAFAYGNTIVPEITAVVPAPVYPNMVKATSFLYAVVIFIYFSIAFGGYAVYGNGAAGFLLSSVTQPKWMADAGNIMTILQTTVGYNMYLVPVCELFETKFGWPTESMWTFRNWAMRTTVRTSYICFCVFIACIFPFFGDLLALIGALGVTPVDFILPCLFTLMYYRPKAWSFTWVSCWFIMVGFTSIGLLASISAVRGIVLDAVNYSAFANT